MFLMWLFKKWTLYKIKRRDLSLDNVDQHPHV